MTFRKLHIGTPKGKKLMPSKWVYMTNKEKNEWLIGHGYEVEDLDQSPEVELYLEVV